MKIGSVWTSSFHSHSNLFFPSVLIYVSLLCPHLFHCSPPHLLIPAFLSPQFNSIFFFGIVAHSWPSTHSLCNKYHTKYPYWVLCVCCWVDNAIGFIHMGSLWSWFYQHYFCLSIENSEWPVHQKGPSSCGSKDFLKLMLAEISWVDAVIFIPLFLFRSLCFLYYTAINSPQSKTLTHVLNINMYVSIQAFKKHFINRLIIINSFISV